MNVCPYNYGATLIVWLRSLKWFSKSPLRVQHLSVFKVLTLSSHSHHFGKSIATTGSWEHTTKNGMYGMSAMMARLAGWLCRCPKRFSATRAFTGIFLKVCLARPEVKGGLAHRHGIPPRVVSCRMFQTCQNGWDSSYWCHKSPMPTRIFKHISLRNKRDFSDDTWT